MEPCLKVNTGDRLQRLKVREALANRVTTAVLGVEEFKNRGNPETLITYWRDGEGADRIDWGSCHDFRRCMKLVGKYVDQKTAAGFCQNRHLEIYGISNSERDKDDNCPD